MTKQSHTPGPWTISQGISWGCIRGRDGYSVVSGDGFAGINMAREEQEANAALIASAPDLLNACRAVLENLGKIEDGSRCYTRADERSVAILEAVIRQAEGK